jgi:hypothetical protein
MRRLVLVLIIIATLGLAQDAGAVLSLGDVTPNFTKLDLTNTPHSLYDYRGKVVVLFLLGYG